jgi:sec-independent protein translocase protein TatA
MLGSIGMPELLIILLIVIVIFGARRLPELGKSLGQGIKNFRKSMSGEEKNEDNSPRNESSPYRKQ